MPNTAELNIANIQVFAEREAAADRATGTYDAHLAADPHYYIWQGSFQTIPMGMNGNPEQFVEQMIRAVPGINCLRIPFNSNSFNADGTLDPLFERFLIAAANHGLQLIPVLADGAAQGFEGTSSAIATALQGEIFSNVLEGWTLMKAWMDRHPTVENAVYGWELLNEPASYQRAVLTASHANQPAMESQMVTLYVQHMAELASIVSEGNDAAVIVSAWGYGGDTRTLENTLIGGQSAIDVLRADLGESLVWSLHYYPGWMGTGGITDPVALQAVWADFIAPLSGDNILMTEINVPGSTTYNPFQTEQIDTATALSLDWLKAAGVGVGWFPALQTGAAGLALIESDGGIRYLNQPSLAAALNAFSFGQDPVLHHNSELIRPELVNAVLRNQPGDPDYVNGHRDAVSLAGLGFGYAGNDTIVGSALANNFLYGGAGNDLVAGANHDDFLYGQDGNDFIVSGDGIDYVFGGNGNDTIVGDYLNNTIYGGAGADQFVVAAGAKLIVVDYSASDHDSWMSSRNGRYVGHAVLDANGDGVSDLRVTLSDGAEILFLGMGGTFGVISVLSGLLPFGDLAERTGETLLNLSNANSAPDINLLINLLANPSGTNAGSISRAASALADSLVGGAAADLINAGGGSDVVYGVTGNDSIDGGAGKDLIFGGSGDDRLLGATGDDLVFGGTGDDVIVGGDGNDLLSGDVGRDQIDGGNDADILSGGADNDTISGGSGDDTLAGDFGAGGASGISGDDLLFGGAGNDILDGGAGRDFLDGGAGNDLIDGGLGVDTAIFSGTASATVNLTVLTSQNTGYGLDRLRGIENISSGFGNDWLSGNDGANVLRSGLGCDTLFGGAGADYLFGGGGRDILDGGAGNDLIDGGLGVDTAIFCSSASATVNLAVLTPQNTGYGLDQLRDIENITSGIGNDWLSGNDGANVLRSGDGRDTLFGGAGDDVLFGGAGRDVIRGGAGADTLIGGGGADSFVFADTLGASNVDTLQDFTHGVDRILLENSVLSGLVEGVLSASAFVANSFGLATDSLDRIIYETDTGRLYYDPDGTGGRGQVLFAVISPGLTISNSDFLIT